MRYALRKQAKIASVYSEDYLNKHIIKSLDSYFGNTSDEHITDDISQEGYVTSTGEDYPILKVNDLSVARYFRVMWMTPWLPLSTSS